MPGVLWKTLDGSCGKSDITEGVGCWYEPLLIVGLEPQFFADS